MSKKTVALILAAATLPMPLAVAVDSLDGEWVGGYERNTDWVYFQVSFKTETEGIKGTYDNPFGFTGGRTLNQIDIDGSRVKFEVSVDPKPIRFVGEMKDGAISGKVQTAEREVPFRMRRIVKTEVSDFAGVYQLEADHYIHVRPWNEFDANKLLFIDYKKGDVRVFFPSSKTAFFAGPAMLQIDPVETTIEFPIDPLGRSKSLMWKQADSAPQTGKRILFKEEEVSFKNGDVTLSGTFIRPVADKKYPAVVLAHGAGPLPREALRSHAEYFALHGIACLLYDKRGVGASTGNWLRSGFGDLAEDALAAVQFLKSRKDINPSKIGLWGSSQGGWIVALAASRSKDVAFIISQSGPGVTPEEQELYRTEAWLRADGFTEDQVQKAMVLVRLRYDTARTGKGWKHLAVAEQAAKKEPWSPYIGITSGKDDPFWHFWSLIRDYDPGPVLEKVKCPVLAIFGQLDTYLPVKKSVAAWQKGLRHAGNRDVTIKVFSRGEHSLIEAKTGGIKEVPRLKRFVPGYFQTQRDWLLKRVKEGGCQQASKVDPLAGVKK